MGGGFVLVADGLLDGVVVGLLDVIAAAALS